MNRIGGIRGNPWRVRFLIPMWLGIWNASAATYLVSPTGNDGGDGTAAAPFRTINRAAREARAGDVVLVRAGIYRERVAPPRDGEPGNPIVYRAEPPGQAVIRGSAVWSPAWTRHRGGVFYGIPDESLFDDDVYLDSPNPFRVPLASTPFGRNGKPERERFGYGDPAVAYTCGQVFVDGVPFTQVPFLNEVEQQPGTWTFERDTGRLYLHLGPDGPGDRLVEITVRRRLFAPHRWGVSHIVVEGFVLEHCGNQYPTNFWNTPVWAQAGALGFRGGSHWTVRGNLIRFANTVAIDAGGRGGDNERDTFRSRRRSDEAGDNLIVDNRIVDNGAAGIIGSGSLRLTIRGNVILRNNTLGFIGNKRYEHAGIKCHGMADGLIEGNYIADNPLNDGVWLDNQFPGARITRNVIVNNGRKGIFLEMSDYTWDTALVDHNVVVGNRLIQFYVHDASGSTVMHNLFANSPAESKFGQGAYIYQVTARTRTGYHSLFNNLFVNHKVMTDINYPSHRGGPQRLDHNLYDAEATDRVFVVNSAADKPSPWTAEAFAARIHDELGPLSPGPTTLGGNGKARMTLPEWRRFWQGHGQTNDLHSVARRGLTVAYNPNTYDLTVHVPFDPTEIGSTAHEKIEWDFFDRPVPRDGSATPGPFQDLRRGRNIYRLRPGLRP